MSRKRTTLGNSLIAKWLYDEGWTQESVAMYLAIARPRVRTVLNKPEQYLSIRDLMQINAMLPEKTFADVINSITRAPIVSNMYIEDEFLITPRQRKKQWMDE
jgi:predicted transcriptional regulator